MLSALPRLSINADVGTRDEMIIIAEISDKMSTIPALWGITALFAAPFLIGALHQKVAWVLLPVALALSVWVGQETYRVAFVKVGMKEAIRNEMGWWWTINSLASPLLPALVAVGVLAWQLRMKRSPNKAAHDTARKLADPGR